MKTGNIISIFFFIIVFIYIVTVDKNTVKKFQDISLFLVSPFFKKGNDLNKKIENMNPKEGQKKYSELLKENNDLKNRIKILSIKKQNYKLIIKENERLRNAINFINRHELELVASEVILRKASTWWNTVTINKGKNHGIEYGDPVLTERGLVGKVISSTKDTANIILITDQRCHVTASVGNSRETGILCGRHGSDIEHSNLILKYLSKNAKVNINEPIFTYEVATFPANIKLGKIIKVSRGDVYTEAIIKPDVNFKKLNIVFVILLKKNTDLDKLSLSTSDYGLSSYNLNNFRDNGVYKNSVDRNSINIFDFKNEKF